MTICMMMQKISVRMIKTPMIEKFYNLLFIINMGGHKVRPNNKIL